MLRDPNMPWASLFFRRSAWIAAFMCSSALASAGAADEPTVAGVIARLRVEERRLHSLYVEAECFAEQQAPGETEWARVSDLEVKVRFFSDGVPGSKVRAEYPRMKNPWVQGKAAAVDSAMVVAYDGRRGTMVTLATGPDGRMLPQKTAEILNGRPPLLDAYPHVSGTCFSSQLFLDSMGMSLSQKMRNDLEQWAKAEPDPAKRFALVTPEADAGTEVLHVSMGVTGIIREDYWLDPNRGMALLRFMETVGDRPPHCETRVLRLGEAADGVWYPLEAVSEVTIPEALKLLLGSANQPGKRRYHYVASRVVANDPKWDERIYDVSLPSGFRVTDRIEGTVRIVGPATQELRDELDEAVRQAFGAATMPAAN